MSRTRDELRWDRIAIGSIVAAFIITALLYQRLPDPLPTHFDLEGNPNGWMSRAAGAWGIPTFAFVLWGFMRFIVRVLPRSDQRRLSGGIVALVAMLTAVFVSAVHVIVLYVAVVPGVVVTRPIFLLMGFFFIALGLILPRVRRNPIIGVRTAWTLASDENWAKTNRVAGYTMVLGGLGAILAGALGGLVGGVLALVFFAGAAIIPVVYSLLHARRHDSG